MMRVVHVIKVIGISGAERHLALLTESLRARDINAEVVLLVEPDNPVSEFVDLLTARQIPVESLVIHHDADVTLYLRLRRLFAERKPELVHTHLLHADLYAIPAARWAGVPVVVTSRHNDNAFRRKPPFREINRWLWRQVDAGVAISEALRTFCIEVEGAPADRLQTILYGFDYPAEPDARQTARTNLRDELGLPADAPLVGLVCRLIEQKGIAYGLRAFEQIAEQHPAAQLVIAGDGNLRAELTKMANGFASAGRIHWLGWRSDALQVLAGLDILLMPSLWEGFGLVMLEAMAQGIPIIGSAVSAIPEIVSDGETGLLVPPRDVDGLAAALTALLSERDRREQMGRRGLERLKAKFTVAAMADTTAALYRELYNPKS